MCEAEAEQQAKGSPGRRQQELAAARRSGHDLHTPGMSGLLNTVGLDTFSWVRRPRAMVLHSAFPHV